MKTTTFLLALAALMAPAAMKAQQNPQPIQAPLPPQIQVQSAAANVPPCGKQSSPPAHKPTWLEKKTKALAYKQNKNFCDLPSSVGDAVGETPKPQPCPTTSGPAPSTSKTAAAGPSPVASATPVPAKPVYVCPPKSSLIPNFPYCVFPDHSVVDADTGKLFHTGPASSCGSGTSAALTRIGVACAKARRSESI
jgi:hypothetical protein